MNTDILAIVVDVGFVQGRFCSTIYGYRGVWIQWTGTLEWNGGMDWNGMERKGLQLRTVVGVSNL